jgi:regulator of replication initiation timing
LFGYIGDQNHWDIPERALRVRWNSQDGFFVENLFHFECTEYKQALDWFLTGVKNKFMASHRLNHSSSRSHCIFEIIIEQQKAFSEDEEQQTIKSKLTLVDLAGSEKLQHYRHDQLMKESININRSLLTLGKCISALTPGSGKEKHVPYRESQLTKLLKHSLGGNCFTMIVACLSPSDSFADENINTLYYASRARRIKNEPVFNENEQQKLIRNLKQEIRDLRAENTTFQQLIQIPQEKTVIHEVTQKTGSDEVVPADAKFLQEKVVSSVNLLKKLSTLNRSLRKSFDEMEGRYSKQGTQNKDLELENQSLRERIEILESLLDGNPSESSSPVFRSKSSFQQRSKSREGARSQKKQHVIRPLKTNNTGLNDKQRNSPSNYRRPDADRDQKHQALSESRSNSRNSNHYDWSRFERDPQNDVNEIASMFLKLHKS